MFDCCSPVPFDPNCNHNAMGHQFTNGEQLDWGI